MKRSLGISLITVALAGCSVPTSGDEATIGQGLAPSSGDLLGWNGGWDHFDNGAMQGKPAIATNGTNWDMVYVGTDGHLYDRTGDGISWGAPQDLGDGTFTGLAAASYSKSGLVIAAVHYNGSVSTRLRSGTNWFDWKNIGGYIIGGGVTIAATGYYVHIFGVGGNNALWEITGVATLWNDGWISRGGNLSSVPPAAVSWGGQRIDIIAPDPSMTPWHYWQDNEVTGVWESMGGKMQQAGAVSSWGPNHLDFFVLGTDNAVYQKTWTGSGWIDWTQLVDCANRWGVSAVSPPSSDVSNQQIDIYVIGMDHNAVWHDRASRHPSSTAGPKPYCCGLPGRGCCGATDQPQACLGQNVQSTYCNPADNKCEQCGSAPGQTCCTLVDSIGSRPMCSYNRSSTVCNIYDNHCVSSGAPGGGAYQVCKAGGICDAGNSCVGRNADRDVAGFCKPNPQPSCGAGGASCSSNASCCSGLACIGGKCTATNGAKTCGGNPIGPQTQAYALGVRNPYNLCAATEYAAYANSQTEATACAQALYPGYTILPGQAYSYYNYAQYSPYGPCMPLQVPAFSQTDANQCAYSTCVNCNNVPNQACP
ncbi:MAG: sialidase [Myxococcales bacterium]|nr:sialidase [Myxococcales bacterium]